MPSTVRATQSDVADLNVHERGSAPNRGALAFRRFAAALAKPAVAG